MSYILHSTEVQLRSSKVMVPPMSMYHMRRLLGLKNEGVDLDNPDAEGVKKLMDLLHEVVQENHPELTFEDFERQVDASNLGELVATMNALPKNSTAPVGNLNQTTPATEGQAKATN